MQTEIIIALDASGSMYGTRLAVKEGLQTILNDNQDKDAVVSIVQFNQKWEFLTFRTPIAKVDRSFIDNYKPGGLTSLQDCVCNTIDNIGKEYANMAPHNRPTKVMFFIVSDGADTSSSTYSAEDVKRRIDHQIVKYSWVFQYLGTNHDAMTAATSYGINAGNAANFSRENSTTAFKKMSDRVGMAVNSTSATAMRAATVYTVADRDDLINEPDSADQINDINTFEAPTPRKAKINFNKRTISRDDANGKTSHSS